MDMAVEEIVEGGSVGEDGSLGQIPEELQHLSQKGRWPQSHQET